MNAADTPHIDWPVWRPMSIPGAPGPAPFMADSASGVYVTDEAGERYLDMTAGLAYVNAGHGRPEIIEAIARQCGRLATFPSHGQHAHRLELELGERLVAMLAPERMSKVMYSSGGSEAVENALKIARQYWKLRGRPEKTRFVSFKLSHHGLGLGSMAVSGVPMAPRLYGPTLEGVHHIDPPYSYRRHDRAEGDALSLAVARELERMLGWLDPGTVAAFIAEPVQCAFGAIVPPATLWPALRQVCTHYDVLMIADEVVTGFGRTGAWFGSRLWGVAPDLMCFAKGINSGYVPFGATAVSERIADAWSGTGAESMILHGHTYAGHPLGCASTMANLDVLEREDLPGNAARVGAHLLEGLRGLARHPLVGEVRGVGLMCAVELVSDRDSRRTLEQADPALAAIRHVLEEERIMVRWISTGMLLTPPLTLGVAEVDRFLTALRRALEAGRPTAGG
ncbi:MAG: hypothetical protein RJA99_3910 [Pseudomonadota bacterium]|jgi:putrescine aminotransferase